ncbi:MAG: P-loop NTPase [Thermincola sp.]|nr:P-loop NTPase [Thermincola sp.]MDT3703201.1 P-loop NTPase [Thermincola sp.]
MSEKHAAGLRELQAVNISMSCDLACERCERFFDCEAPQKHDIYKRGRMEKARRNMERVRYKIAIVGGKGGVGKSTLTANLACALANDGNRTSVLDQDFDGPTIPRMLGVTDKKMMFSEKGIQPVEGILGIQVVSTGCVVGTDEVLTWFHDMRRGATEEFLAHVDYGERDYLLIDLPPGTSSDSVNLMQYIPDLAGAIIITVPSDVSQVVARKAALLCGKAGVPILGVVENMSGFVCPDCGRVVNIFRSGGGEKLAESLGVPFMGNIPLDAKLSDAADSGRPYVLDYPDSPASKALQGIAAYLREILEKKN